MNMIQEIIYIVHMVKEKLANRWFVVLKRTPEFGSACFHATGVWTNDDPTKVGIELDLASLRDEYIPWYRIDHITNCVYKPR
jgi:hypothetical protein